ncbi:MAG: Smr/MutS family protein [Acidobacteria bacterium]|nr:Smr/MutS family protein [Acidobacteriota bacterium]
MDELILQALEFPEILSLLGKRTVTPLGAQAAIALRPAHDQAIVRLQTTLTMEAVRYLRERGALPFGTVPNPAPILARLAVRASLPTPIEILELLALMKSGRAVRSALTEVRAGFPNLWRITCDLPNLGNVIRFLDGRIASSGEFEDHASDDLHATRRDIQRRNERLNSLLREISARPEIRNALQDDFVSIRSERHVLPIRVESRSALPGIVHGVSGTGSTLFVEPLETVELNNEIVTLKDQEAVEVTRLLQEYGDLLRSRLPELRSLATGLGRIDLVMARARLGEEMRGLPAEISEDGGILLVEARHPILERSLGKDRSPIVPLDLALEDGTRVLMISGPNTGGKTVALKTVGLFSLMHQAGFLLPAGRTRLPIFRGVFIDIGDRQSITGHLSTFSARMHTAASITRDLRPPALVLLDEIGTGTDPEEGVALGIALIEHYRRCAATVIATTHMEAFKAYASGTSMCVNAAMEFDETTLRPTYRLIHGIPGRSGAFEVAARIGLPRSILEDARARSGSSGRLMQGYLKRLQDQSIALESHLRELEAERASLAADRSALETELLERGRRQSEAIASEIELALGRIREEGKRYMDGLKDQAAAARARRAETRLASRLRSEARRLIRHAHGQDPSTGGPGGRVRVGEGITIDSLGQRGIVESIRGKRVVARIRGKRVTVALADCRMETGPVEDRQPRRRPPGVTLQRQRAHGETPSHKIHLRGLKVEEALTQVDKFLDDAYLESLSPVRLIHGLGTGRLKKGIISLLTGHPHVASFANAPAEEGGAGVTVVVLRP